MDDLFSMRRIKGIGNLCGEREVQFRIERAARDHMLQRLTIQKLHDKERPPVLQPHFINRADIGMVQPRSGLRFALKTCQCKRVASHVIRQKLESDEAVVSLYLPPYTPPPYLHRQ